MPGKRPTVSTIICVYISPEPTMKEDIECCDSDEADSFIEILSNGEKIASSEITLKSKRGIITSQVNVDKLYFCCTFGCFLFLRFIKQNIMSN